MIRLTRAQVRQIDRRAIAEFNIPGIVLMENAAISAYRVLWQMLYHQGIAPEVMVLCGPGNNGGDGLALARHLHNSLRTRIALAVDPQTYRGDALTNWQIIEQMRVPVDRIDHELPETKRGLIVDALFGTGLTRHVEGRFADLIKSMNTSGRPILALDLPSGMDCDTGEPLGACAKATRTVTFVAEKIGFANPASKQYTGAITVGDIGCPRELIEQVSITNQQSPDL